ncbi:cell wall-binding repeat-containing protein [Ornithinimicrobium sp. F0845]|uniref:cell wall-binding repeat-containing protein n=1 Tax=Ornithinimicrobium sp. F0845 TaxID=2926412 RepID=UPI001FF28706|nr:cell wall-binding repeat-containing protein [Ornithinimicrobium sp. F0845]MCK0113408.1 cell wall-binding repeat-containing protein [Ornithinimicrobium sp. F0845]
MIHSHPRWRRGSVAAVAAASLVASGAALATTAAQADPEDATSSTSPSAVTVERISGVDRFGTAAAVAAEYPSADVVYIASGTNYADALTARDHSDAVAGPAPLGDNLWSEGQDGGNAAPVLLVRRDHIPNDTRAALAGISPDRIVVVGGSEAVSSEVFHQLEAYSDDVERLSGTDRYGTAAAIAERWPTGTPVVFLTSGENFPDALTGGAVASRANAPILLTRAGKLPNVTAAALAEIAPSSVVVIGGTGAVSSAVEADVAAIVPDTRRVGGVDRYDTAAQLADRYEADGERAFVATGRSYPDALTGSSLAGYEGAPLLLSKTATVPNFTMDGLDSLSPQGLAVFGGTAAVNNSVVGALNAQLPAWVNSMHLQLLSFNDYHGHLEADAGQTLTEEQDPEQHEVGGVEYLSTKLSELRVGSQDGQSLTVAAGDLIGGSTFISGMFHDEPAVESLNILGLDISSVGNHEFDEGTEELLRMQNGGCHPVDGCYFPEDPFAGADYQYLAANVVKKDGSGTLLPGTEVREIDGIPVGFIGMTLEETPTLVSPGGVATVDFLDEVETANAAAAALQAQGVESIVVLLHEGGYSTTTYNGCEGISGPIVDIHNGLDPAIDAVVTGHTHQPYVCHLEDPAGDPRLVTSAAQWGGVVTATDLPIDRTTGDVIREKVTSNNKLVLRGVADAAQTALLEKWGALSDAIAGQIVGTHVEDITGDSSGDRGIETPMANLVADAILWGTAGDALGGAEISFMNVGGVRASLYMAPTGDEGVGEITYAESYAIAPFGNLLVSIDMTGADIKAVLEQQFDPNRGRQYLALGVSDGFTYTWDDTQPQGSKVSDMELNGVPLEMGTTYRVSTLSFLQEGGDGFTAFTNGTNLVGGPEDLANLVAYFGAHPGLTAPEDRVAGL